MTSYDFFPFVQPNNVGRIEFPSFETIMRRDDISLKEEKKVESKTKETNIDDLSIDFDKLKISRGRQSKNSSGYNHDQLRRFGNELKKRGYDIDQKSKESLITSILLFAKVIALIVQDFLNCHDLSLCPYIARTHRGGTPLTRQSLRRVLMVLFPKLLNHYQSGQKNPVESQSIHRLSSPLLFVAFL